jgi:hypothetical protein
MSFGALVLLFSGSQGWKYLSLVGVALIVNGFVLGMAYFFNFV